MLIRARSHDRALDAVLAYGELLRVLQAAGPHQIPLRQEVDFIERYLSVERMRFGDRLRTSVSLSREDGEALVPNLLLQPLVENAICHGFGELEDEANLEIIASRHDGYLRLEVRDNGAGLSPEWQLERESGLGLKNTSARLQSLYGDAHRLELSSRRQRGTEVLIEIPYQLAAAAT
jgi:LytS/YehU family sensor histidine kinase